MYLIIANILRVVVMAFVTAAPLTALQELFDGTVRKLVEAIRDEQGLTLDEAKDILANILWDLSLNAAIVGTIIKTKIAVKTAEYLGLTSKGFAKRTLSTKAAAVVKKVSGPWEKFKAYSLMSKVLTLLAAAGGLVWIAKGLADIIEPGAYQTKQINRIYKQLGIPFQYETAEPSLQPGNFSKEAFSKFAGSLEAAGIKGVENPVQKQSQIYSRENLADVADYVYGQKVLEGTPPLDWRGTAKLMAPYLIGASASAITAAASGTVAAGVTTPSNKVFIGTVSDGVLGEGLKFTPRPDDLIENMAELQSAINNNLAPFLVTLPGRIIYEVKVVSSIVDAMGLKRYGQMQKIQTGVDSLGQPKTKTVFNKWAVLYLYVLTDKGSRAKITSIVLGPTDALKFRPDISTLAAVSQVIPQSAITLNTSDISSVVPSTPKPPTVEGFAQAVGVPAERINQQTGEIIDPTPAEIAAFNYQFSTTPAPLPSVPRSGDTANTLFEWYQSQGQTLPSLSNRAQLYQSLGLGQSSLYVGTAEQNTKLLAKLKEKPPPPPPVATAQPAPAVSGGFQTPAPSGFFRPARGTPVFDRGSGSSLGLADGNTDYNSAIVRT